jgi:hypothetical protein
MLLPIWKQSSILIDDPSVIIPYVEIALPNLAKERTLIEDPKCSQSRTEIPDPIRPTP